MIFCGKHSRCTLPITIVGVVYCTFSFEPVTIVLDNLAGASRRTLLMSPFSPFDFHIVACPSRSLARFLIQIAASTLLVFISRWPFFGTSFVLHDKEKCTNACVFVSCYIINPILCSRLVLVVILTKNYVLA